MIIGMSIGKLGKVTGTAVETVRYYEKVGLLTTPARTSSNYRSYGNDDVARLSFIRRARALGFSIEQVRNLIGLADDRTRSCVEVDELARVQLIEVDRKIADLRSLRRELSSLINQCQRGTIAECRILDALGPREHALLEARP